MLVTVQFSLEFLDCQDLFVRGGGGMGREREGEGETYFFLFLSDSTSYNIVYNAISYYNQYYIHET